MEVKQLNHSTELGGVLPLIGQLRPYFERDELAALVELQRELGYQIAYVQEDDHVSAIVGFVVSETSEKTKVLSIDGVVEASESQQRLAGQLILEWLGELAQNKACQQIRWQPCNIHATANDHFDRFGFTNQQTHHRHDMVGGFVTASR